MKADEEFQRTCAQRSVDFPAGSTWMAFTDQVSHAAMAGQYQLEQTFLVAVDAMIDPAKPYLLLERLTQADVTAVVAERLARALGIDTDLLTPRLRALTRRLAEAPTFQVTEP